MQLDAVSRPRVSAPTPKSGLLPHTRENKPTTTRDLNRVHKASSGYAVERHERFALVRRLPQTHRAVTGARGGEIRAFGDVNGTNPRSHLAHTSIIACAHPTCRLRGVPLSHRPVGVGIAKTFRRNNLSETVHVFPRLRRALTLRIPNRHRAVLRACLLYTSDAADEGLGVDLGGRRII